MTALIPGRSFESVFNASGLPGLVAQYGDWFSYDRSPRAQIFRRNQSLVHDMDSMIQLMRCMGDSEPGVTWHALCCSRSLIQTSQHARAGRGAALLSLSPAAAAGLPLQAGTLTCRCVIALGWARAQSRSPTSSGPPCP